MFKKVAIVGVGLIGGSIGLAIRKKKLARDIFGICRRKSSLKDAISRGAINRGALDMRAGIENADLIIIATSVERVMDKIKEAAYYSKQGAVIIDVNSTKEKVVRYSDEIMPEGVYFVGTHPLAGAEESGVSAAASGLFDNSICIITPTLHTDKRALEKVKRFWAGIGADVMFFSPKQHDEIVANTSHLPHVLSYCLCNTIPVKEAKVAGTGLKDTTRIAKSNPYMWSDIFFQNKKNVMLSIGLFEKNLRLLKADIKKGRKKALQKRLCAAKAKRDSIG